MRKRTFEVMLTGTSREVLPVTRINAHALDDARPRPMAVKLRRRLEVGRQPARIGSNGPTGMPTRYGLRRSSSMLTPSGA